MKKINIIICSLVSSILLFFILTGVQNKIINYEPKGNIFIAVREINANQKITDEMVKKVLAPISMIDGNVVSQKLPADIYARENIHIGQILLKNTVGGKEELKILDKELGYETISIKLKGPENAISYQIKQGDKVNLYFTGKYVSALSLGLYDAENIEGKMYTAKLLENREILGIYDANGVSSNNESFVKPDTIVMNVTYDEAKLINNLRNQGTFDITG
ncbi:MAG: SAF domain-containing protein [Clostridia bacterium]|nr:SAF domain-containing protein [Clostridia bacterium]